MRQREYLDLDLAIDAQGPGYLARVIDSPTGQASAPFVLPFSATELAQFIVATGPPRVSARRLSPAVAPSTDVREFGRRLHDAVFTGAVGTCLTVSLDRAERDGKGLRIRLRLSGAPDLDVIPWEYLYSSAFNRFLALSADTPVVRHLDTRARSVPVSLEPPLRVLVMVSSPSDAPALDVAREMDLLRATTADLTSAGLLELVFLEQATLSGLQHRLYERFHVFHFVGHGGFDPLAGEGVLVLEDDAGASHRVSGFQLGTLLHDAHDMQLAVLNACEGARTSGENAFSGVGQALVRQGLPAVVAMQDEISDRAAIAFAHEFYFALGNGQGVDEAVSEARKAIFLSDQRAEWGTPVLLRSAADQPFVLASGSRVQPPPREEHWDRMRSAAEEALATGAASTAVPLLEQLAAERPGDADVARLLGQVEADDGVAHPGWTISPSLGPPGSSVGQAGAPSLAPPPLDGAPSRAPTPVPTPSPGPASPTLPPPSDDQRATMPPSPPPTRLEARTPLPPSELSRSAPEYVIRERKPVGLVVGAVVALLVVAAGVVWVLNRPDPGGGGLATEQSDEAAVLSACGAAGEADDIDRRATVATCVVQPPTIDGDMGEWEGLPEYSSVHPIVRLPEVTSDVGGRWQVAWNRDALYVHVRVRDPELHAVDTGLPSQFFLGDGVSFEFGDDPRGVTTDAPLRGNDVHLMIGVTGDQALGSANRSDGRNFQLGAFEPQVNARLASRDDGYELEATVPWSVLSTGSPTQGTVFGMNLNVSDGFVQREVWVLGQMVSSNPDRTAERQRLPGTWDLLVLDGPPGG